jgi:hypothetical protein
MCETGRGQEVAQHLDSYVMMISLQQPDNGPHPESNESSETLPTLFLKDPFTYYPTIYAWVFQVVFPSVLPTIIFCAHIDSPMCGV